MKFEALYEWALPPIPREIDEPMERDTADLYESSFRFIRARRVPHICPPWRLGQRIGWSIRSPIDKTMTPLPQQEVAEEVAKDAAVATGADDIWLRGGAALIMTKTPWLHAYQFRDRDEWSTMFLPNGLGSLEWRLGWVPLVEQKTLMILPSERADPALGVMPGVSRRR
jgi:hypothetical protein